MTTYHSKLPEITLRALHAAVWRKVVREYCELSSLPSFCLLSGCGPKHREEDRRRLRQLWYGRRLWQNRL